MPDLNGGQLTIDGTSGPFDIVTDAWFPLEDALTPLWFGNQLEGDDTRVGIGDWVLNPTGWAPTTHQIEMWFMGHVNADGDRYDNVMEGFKSNVAQWRTEILDPTVIAREATLTLPGGEEWYATLTRLRLTGSGRRRPTGWPLTFEFQIKEPFSPGGS